MREFLIFFLFLVFPICGIQSLMEGNIGTGVFFLLPLMLALCVFAYQQLYQKPLDKRYDALHKKYKLPYEVRGDNGEKWDKDFQMTISKAIASITEPKKKSELQRCQTVAKEMIKDSGANRLDRPFYKINNAFRLTGCHLTITDSKGNTIVQIV